MRVKYFKIKDEFEKLKFAFKTLFNLYITKEERALKITGYVVMYNDVDSLPNVVKSLIVWCSTKGYVVNTEIIDEH